MDDSDIIVLDSSEEQPSTSHNVFSIASPAVCQRWTRPRPFHAQSRRRQTTSRSPWLSALNQPANYQPQPIITSVTSLSPRRNQPITISEVKSLPNEKNSVFRGNRSSYVSRNSPFTYQISQPIITHVESLSPLKNLHKGIHDGSLSISSQNSEPECIVLDDDDGNVSLNSIQSHCPTDLNKLDLVDLKIERTDILQIDCESSLSKVSCDNSNPILKQMEKQSKSIDSCEGAVTGESSQKSGPDHSSDTTNSIKTKKRVRPTPVGISKTLQDFKDECLKAADSESDMKTILENKLEKHLKNCSISFKQSSSFHSLLLNMLKRVQTDPKNLYVHISELVIELKARKASKEEAQEPPKKKSKSNSKESVTVDYEALQSARDLLKMKKLSKTLSILQKMIAKLESKEVSWDDEGNSSYLKLQRYKERAVKVFNKLCEYTKESPSAGKIKKIHLSNGTKFPEVNKCVEQFVNSTGQFPDFCDILELMKKSNEDQNMNLQDHEIEEMAKRVFEEVGGELQTQRKHGVAESLLVFIEGSDDPADASQTLQSHLKENSQHWKKINDIIDEFAVRAKEKKGGSEESKSNGEDEEEDEDDDDDDEGEDEEDAEDNDNDNEEDLENIEVPDDLKSDIEGKSDCDDESESGDDASKETSV